MRLPGASGGASELTGAVANGPRSASASAALRWTGASSSANATVRSAGLAQGLAGGGSGGGGAGRLWAPERGGGHPSHCPGQRSASPGVAKQEAGPRLAALRGASPEPQEGQEASAPAWAQRLWRAAPGWLPSKWALRCSHPRNAYSGVSALLAPKGKGPAPGQGSATAELSEAPKPLRTPGVARPPPSGQVWPRSLWLRTHAHSPCHGRKAISGARRLLQGRRWRS